MEQRLSLVTLGCDDLATARAFYSLHGWREGGPISETVALMLPRARGDVPAGAGATAGS
jgi:hypothetical protein